MRKSIRKSTLALKIVPVLAGSAFKNKGIQPLLDAVVDYLPSPLDVPPVEGIDPGTDEVALRRAADDQPFAALAFKIMSDPFVGSRHLHSRLFRRSEIGQLCTSTPARIRASASAACCRCMPTSAKRSTKFMRAIFARAWD